MLVSPNCGFQRDRPEAKIVRVFFQGLTQMETRPTPPGPFRLRVLFVAPLFFENDRGGQCTVRNAPPRAFTQSYVIYEVTMHTLFNGFLVGKTRSCDNVQLIMCILIPCTCVHRIRVHTPTVAATPRRSLGATVRGR